MVDQYSAFNHDRQEHDAQRYVAQDDEYGNKVHEVAVVVPRLVKPQLQVTATQSESHGTREGKGAG